MNKTTKDNLAKDFWIIVFSVIVAVFLVKSGLLRDILNLTKDFWVLNTFIAGILFTSVFTTALAIVALGEIAQSSQSVIPVALLGGLGALCGDLIIFRFMRDRLGEDIIHLIGKAKNRRLRHIFQLKFFRRLTFFLGALVIASPLPDELGLTMMGFSKTKTSLFIPVSFVFNSLGILVIGLVAKNLLGN